LICVLSRGPLTKVLPVKPMLFTFKQPGLLVIRTNPPLVPGLSAFGDLTRAINLVPSLCSYSLIACPGGLVAVGLSGTLCGKPEIVSISSCLRCFALRKQFPLNDVWDIRRI